MKSRKTGPPILGERAKDGLDIGLGLAVLRSTGRRLIGPALRNGTASAQLANWRAGAGAVASSIAYRQTLGSLSCDRAKSTIWLSVKLPLCRQIGRLLFFSAK